MALLVPDVSLAHLSPLEIFFCESELPFFYLWQVLTSNVVLTPDWASLHSLIRVKELALTVYHRSRSSTTMRSRATLASSTPRRSPSGQVLLELRLVVTSWNFRWGLMRTFEGNHFGPLTYVWKTIFNFPFPLGNHLKAILSSFTRMILIKPFGSVVSRHTCSNRLSLSQQYT